MELYWANNTEFKLAFAFIKEQEFPYHQRDYIFIKNTTIKLSGFRLEFDSKRAQFMENKVIKSPDGTVGYNGLEYGERMLPLSTQKRIFNAIKRYVLKYRKVYFEKKQGIIKNEYQKFSFFEEDIFGKEHQLENYILNTIAYFESLHKKFPRVSLFEVPLNRFGKKYDDPAGKVAHQEMPLQRFIAYLQVHEIEAVHLSQAVEDKIQFEKLSGKIKAQKKHLQKLLSCLNQFVKQLGYMKQEVSTTPVTKEIKDEIRAVLELFINDYKNYALFFKSEINK